MSHDTETLPLAVTLGEPAGIGPEITLAAWLARKTEALPPFYVRGPAPLFSALAERLKLAVPVEATVPERALTVFDRALPVIDTGDAFAVVPGSPSAETAAAVIASIEQNVADIHAGKASGIVTNPIQKKALYDAGFRHPGHTEFLGALAERWNCGPTRPVMMLAGPELRTVPVTVHIPLADVPAALNPELIVNTATIVDADMRRRFGIVRPRLAIAGVNPHAGEEGAIGREDGEIIAPAVARLQALGIDATGPLPADTLFHPAARAQYDVVLGMYHDQALIPVKALAFDETVNVTLGLPFVRTSPDHGTALGIAGKGTARPQSLMAAIRLAGKLAANSTSFADAT